MPLKIFGKENKEEKYVKEISEQIKTIFTTYAKLAETMANMLLELEPEQIDNIMQQIKQQVVENLKPYEEIVSKLTKEVLLVDKFIDAEWDYLRSEDGIIDKWTLAINKVYTLYVLIPYMMSNVGSFTFYYNFAFSKTSSDRMMLLLDLFYLMTRYSIRIIGYYVNDYIQVAGLSLATICSEFRKIVDRDPADTRIKLKLSLCERSKEIFGKMGLLLMKLMDYVRAALFHQMYLQVVADQPSEEMFNEALVYANTLVEALDRAVQYIRERYGDVRKM